MSIIGILKKTIRPWKFEGEYKFTEPPPSTFQRASKTRTFKVILAVLLLALLIAIAIPIVWVFLLNRTNGDSGPHGSKGGRDLALDDVYLINYRRTVESKIRQWRVELNTTTALVDASGGGMAGDDTLPSSKLSIPERGYIIHRIVIEMARMKNSTFESLRRTGEADDVLNKIAGDLCESDVICSPDVASSPYRTFDGSCNNLNKPHWGKSNRQQRRTLPHTYDDGIGAPRSRSVLGSQLPSTRVISNTVHRSRGANLRTDNTSTVIVMAFGQFFSHDLSLSPHMNVPNAAHIECCDKGYTIPGSGPFESCFPIDLPADDTYYHSDCMTFVRSAPAVCDKCSICRREQLNKMTSYIDASQVYGASLETSNKLRSFVGGRLLVTDDKNLLPGDKDSACTLTDTSQRCFMAGDSRVNVVPNLSSFHVMFVRYHNHIATGLQEINLRWGDEKLFQEARKIVIAITQKIVYNEYLPIVLGEDTMRRFELYSKQDGHHSAYDVTLDATVSNSFSTAAFRFGHTTIPDNQISLNPTFEMASVSPIEKTFNNPDMTYRHCDGLARWMANRHGIVQDGNFVDGVRNLLFMKNNVSFDLVARNIQRGRDHGIPTYNQWRRFCDLAPITDADFRIYGSQMADFNVESSNAFRKAYRSPEDIDLFSGAIKEERLQGAQVGPTFACILGMEFHRLKHGDRFYFENPSPAGGPNIGFTADQLASLKKSSLAKITCETMSSPHIQTDVFRPPSVSNPLRMCSSLDDVDLSHWKDNS